MCSPSIFFSALGAVVSFAGARAQGKAEQQRYDYQAKVDANNKKVSEWKAQDAIARGDIKEKQHRLKVSQLKGRQNAVISAGGIEVADGSALDILADTAWMGELDALTIRSNSEREAYDYRVQASNQGAQSQLNTMAGQNAATAGNYNAMTSLLSGAGSVADKWYTKKGYVT